MPHTSCHFEVRAGNSLGQQLGVARWHQAVFFSREHYGWAANLGDVCAAQVVEYLDEGAGPEVSYRVLMDDNGELYWLATDDGKPLRYDTDPLSTPEQRFKAQFWKILPILEQL